MSTIFVNVDTMLAAPILDENRFSYALNSLGFDYLQEVKSEQGLKQAAADFGVHPKKELWKLPAMYVGEYAEQEREVARLLCHLAPPRIDHGEPDQDERG